MGKGVKPVIQCRRTYFIGVIWVVVRLQSEDGPRAGTGGHPVS